MSGLRSRHAFLFRSHSCWYVFPLVPQTGRFIASRHPVHAHLALPFPLSMQTLPEGQTFLSHGFAAKKRELQGNNKDHYVRIIAIPSLSHSESWNPSFIKELDDSIAMGNIYQ